MARQYRGHTIRGVLYLCCRDWRAKTIKMLFDENDYWSVGLADSLTNAARRPLGDTTSAVRAVENWIRRQLA